MAEDCALLRLQVKLFICCNFFYFVYSKAHLFELMSTGLVNFVGNMA
jgi:hypothetical protein